MGWHIEYLANQHAVRASYSGRTTVGQLVEMVGSAVQMAATRRTDRILLDCTAAKLNLTAAQIYGLPPLFEEVGIHAVDRVAIVHGGDPHHAEDLGYYGTLAREYGLDHRVFADAASAMNWLVTFPVKDRHSDSRAITTGGRLRT